VLCCEAPQYGSAKSVANIAGMVAANVLRGDHPLVHWDTVDWEAIRADDNALIVDVREVSRWALRGCVYPRGGGTQHVQADLSSLWTGDAVQTSLHSSWACGK
jgi:hypothetical protein